MDETIFTHIGDWQDFDPGWLVALAEDQHPEHPQIASALQACTRCQPSNQAYLTFVDPGRPQYDAPWQFAANVWLHDPDHGEIIIDVLTNGRIGGLEFIDRIEA
jgi:hypothetical protein